MISRWVRRTPEPAGAAREIGALFLIANPRTLGEMRCHFHDTLQAKLAEDDRPIGGGRLWRRWPELGPPTWASQAETAAPKNLSLPGAPRLGLSLLWPPLLIASWYRLTADREVKGEAKASHERLHTA